MKTPEFYVLDSKYVSTTFTASPEGIRPYDQTDFPDDLKLLLGRYDEFKFPTIFRQSDGKVLRDFLDTGYPSLFLISERVKKLLEEHGFTGWQTYPIELYDKKGNKIEGYYGFSVTGRCGKVDWSKSVKEKGKAIYTYKGLYFDVNEWDGSDFCVPDNYYAIIVTKPVAEVLKKNKITNIKLTFTKEHEHYDYRELT